MSEPKKILFSAFLDELEIPSKRQKPFITHMAGLFLLVVSILFFDPSGFSPDVVEGQICPKTIRCPKNISFVDERKTNELRQIEKEKVEPVLQKIGDTEQKMAAQFEEFLITARNFYNDWKGKDFVNIPETEIASYFGKCEKFLEVSEITELLSVSKAEFEILQSTCRKIFKNQNQKFITSRNLENIRAEVKKEVYDYPLSALTNRLVNTIVKNALKVNSIEDENATRMKRDAAARSVSPVRRTFQKGQKIIDEGVNVTADDVYVLKTIEKQIQKNRILSFSGNVLLTGLLMLISLLHLRFTRQGILKDFELVRLMGALWIGALLFTKIVFALGSAYDQVFLPVVLSPIPTVGLLMSLLLDPQIAIFHQMLLGVLVFVVAESNARLAIVSLLGGVLGILVSDFSLRQGNIRSLIGWTGLKIGFANLVGLLALALIDAENFALAGLNSSLFFLACGLGNGILTGILTNGILPYIESFFSLATGSKLLELADLSQPLLKRLAEEAPGTYQHSIMVAALAEAAAKEIRADSLLAKIGSYFHDIGKLKRPGYFGENQAEKKSQHDHLTPYMSSLILVGHIRDGVELAKENEIPERVIAFIKQHHGTTLISYFFEQAKSDTENQDVKEERFRYPGPKPQTKETAIVMLADSIEAAARTLPQYSHQRIEGLVKKIIENKLNDENQLDESDLTLKDIEKIEQTFVRVLTSMYHGRVDYPGKLSNQPKGGGNGSTD